MLRKKKLAMSFLLAVTLATAEHVSGEMTLKHYKEFKPKELTRIEIYVTGLGDAFSWANTYLEQRSFLFCQPSKLALGTKNYMRILDDEIQRKIYKEEHSIGLILLMGLKETFPCSK